MDEIKIDCISNKTIKKIRKRILGKNKTIKQIKHILKIMFDKKYQLIHTEIL